jgi:hypothetical protein
LLLNCPHSTLCLVSLVMAITNGQSYLI